MTQEALEFAELPSDAILRIGEVDRTEAIEGIYRCLPSPDGRALQLTEVRLDPPGSATWSPADVQERIEKWAPELDGGGTMFGALSGDRLRGFSIVSANRTDGSAELVALFVDAAHRGSGIGTKLLRLAEDRARASHATAMYIGSNPIVPCVDFYLGRGAQLMSLTDRRVVRALPGGAIVLALVFDPPT
jgi:GNAT superfamily N-acetyltransferase